MSKPLIATRIAAPATKSGESRTGWIVQEVREDDTAFRAFVWQHERGAEELFRVFHRDTIAIVGGFEVTVKEYQKVLRNYGIAV
jgi:hypothetical protein